MSRNPETVGVSVDYQDADPHRIEVRTKRWSNDCRYTPTYKFKLNGSTAVLVTIVPDGDRYHVQGNAGTVQAAADSVSELPFVDEVDVFGGVVNE